MLSSKLISIKQNKFSYLIFLILVIIGPSINGQTVDFIPAGHLSTYSKYNINVSTASGIDGTGGFSFTGSLLINSTNYGSNSRYLLMVALPGTILKMHRQQMGSVMDWY